MDTFDRPADARPSAITDLERRAILGVAGLAGVAALAKLAHAGPLNPPVGPVASTAKPLGEIEARTAINATNTPGDASAVFVIANDGAYYLPADISVPINKIGIKITAINVTIDLNGFKIASFATGTVGISMPTAAGGSSVAILNGKIVGSGGNGILAYGQSVLVENVSVQDCGGHGMDLQGNVIRVRSCGAFRCTQNGFNIQAGSVENCVSELNTGIGFNSTGSVVYESCLAQINTGGGFKGGYVRALNCASIGGSAPHFQASSGLAAEGCWATGGTIGYTLTVGNNPFAIFNCVATGCSGIGFDLSPGVVAGALTSCVAFGCTGGGFRIQSGSIVTNCVARTCAGTGFQGGGSTFIGCYAYFNGYSTSGPGFSLTSDCTVDRCTATSSGSSGFTATGNCNITNCHAANNGAAGISLSGTHNTVDSCSVYTNSSAGIQSGGAGGNFITRNRLSGNTPNLSLSGTNLVGPSVTPGGMATATPWANFEI